jgi:hypothetical protein
MFRENNIHIQPALISAIQDLPEKQRIRLEQSWSGIFYRDFFSQINESAFAVLYSDLPSRPNIPVNVLIGLEVIKAGNGWSDQETYDAFLYNLQVRYALGYDRLGEGEFDIRTLYNFRQRLSAYNAQHGVNLLEQAFEQITDQQIANLKVRTGYQRMDSTQVASNILDASRLHLLVEGVQRLHRLASEGEQEQLAEVFSPFVKDKAEHYAYRIKGKEATQQHLAKVGQTLDELLKALQASHENEPAYQVVEQLFEENFHQVESAVQPKNNREIPASSLQSLDDLEASYRIKANQHYKGYVANLTETCDPENELQLITKVQVAPNTTEDSQLLQEALPNLRERTDLNTLVVDGAYPNEANDESLRQQGVQLIQTGIRGTKPDPQRFQLADFEIEQNEVGEPVRLTCPYDQTAFVTQGRTSGWFARFPAEVCATCPYQLEKRCRTRPQMRDPRYFLDFTLQEMRVALRRQAYTRHKKDDHNLRAAVEASVRSLKHPFPAGKLPVRGCFRMTCMLIASAIFVNVRRITYFKATKKQDSSDHDLQNLSFLCFWRLTWLSLRSYLPVGLIFG